MPTYSYECQQCGVIVEKFLSISQMKDEFHECCVCSKSEPTKWKLVVVSPSEFRLKGVGWYESDFKNSATDTVRRVVK